MSGKKNKPKRNNHEVGRSFLGPWKDPGLPNNGIWLLDLETQKIESRSKDATFAVHSYLYVPSVNGQRDDRAEDWLAGAEHALAQFIQRIAKKDFATPISAANYAKVLLGLFSLSYRSGFEIKELERQLREDESLRNQMGVATEEDIHRTVVENMINVITLQVEQFIGGGAQVLFNCKAPILICDRPGFDMDVRSIPFAVVPLGPNAMIMIEKPGEGRLPLGISWIEHDGNTRLIEMLNDFTIKRARSWVVASTKEQLERIRSEFTADKIKERAEKDTIKFTSLDGPTKNRLWTLRK